MVVITGLRALDIRFPTSTHQYGSEAMNIDPDYSAADVIQEAKEDGLARHGMTSTIGRGSEIVRAGIGSLARRVVGPDSRLMIDANQVWKVDEAISWLTVLKLANPWFIEEPTYPDDIEGHRKIPTRGAYDDRRGDRCNNGISPSRSRLSHHRPMACS